MYNLKVKRQHKPRLRPTLVATALVSTLALSGWSNTDSHAEPMHENRVTTSLYGKAGLVEMPNALFFDTGHLSMTGMLKDPDDRTTLNFQPLPWFEGSFRYSVIEGYSLKTNRDLFDRSFDFKIRALKQGTWWPAVAVGIQDIAGTGIYSSEFVVATWQTKNFNITGGVGFGRFASAGNLTNPLTFISSAAKSRAGFKSGTNDTGKIRTGQYFQGEDMGVFGGIEYLTPVRGLKFTAEYSSDTYFQEEFRGIADVEIPFNFDLNYRYSDNIEFGTSWIQGNTFALRLTLQLNPNTQSSPPRLDPPRFQFRNRENDPAPEVKPFSADSKLYRQFSALHGQSLTKDGASSKRDYLSAENTWNPWEKQDLGHRQHEAVDRNLSPVPRTVDVTWTELPQITHATRPGDEVARIHYAVADDSPENWRLASWRDETSSHPADSELTISKSDEAKSAANSIPTPKDYEAVARARNPVWSWPLTEDEKDQIAESIREAAAIQKIAAIALDFDDTKLSLYYYNGTYHREAEAIGRLLAILTQAAPSRIETFTLIAVVSDLQVSEITIPRGTLERIVFNSGSPQELFNVTKFEPGQNSRPRGMRLTKGAYPSVSYGMSPSIRYSLFDPDDPLRYQISALVTGRTDLFDGFSLSAIYRLNIYDNFDEISRRSNSRLPHVRSDFANYLNQAEHGMEMLVANYDWQPGRNWFSRSFVGYLEEMYAGIGSEVLYRPYGQRWALGLEVDYVQQRNFDRGFGLRDYTTVTGFAKWYYEVPYQDLKLELNVGRYLAQDIGATFKISKTFDNGTEIGAFATLTDVPFDLFGEGSFDKGIILKIPFHTFSFFDTKSVYSTVIRPLTRDGGAQLWSGTPLYDTTHQYSLGQLRRNWRAIFK